MYIPDEIAGSLNAGGDLSRRVPEGFALGEYQSERISKAQLRHLPGFETRYELDDFLKAHQVRAQAHCGKSESGIAPSRSRLGKFFRINGCF